MLIVINEGGINCLAIVDFPLPAAPAKKIHLGCEVDSLSRDIRENIYYYKYIFIFNYNFLLTEVIKVSNIGADVGFSKSNNFRTFLNISTFSS